MYAGFSRDSSDLCPNKPFDRLHVTRVVNMPARTQAKPSSDKVRAHRARLRKQGLRPIQIWVPDTRSPAFAKEARRQSLAVARSSQAGEDQDFIDAVTDWGGPSDS
jgi:hypothetical protein